MEVRLSALHASCHLSTGRLLALISVRGCVDPRTMVWLEGLSQLKNPVTSSIIKPAIIRLVVVLQLCHLVLPSYPTVD
jgi:hypothetical protein